MKQTFLSLLLLLLPIAASADANGTCGDNLTWTFESATGTLTISGTGAMTDFNSPAPWDGFRTNILRVVIENGVTSIVHGAFEGCTELSSLTIPISVTSIGDYAFDDCSSLTSISIPNEVTSIGDCAFWGCSNLTNVSIPNSVTFIGDGAFYDTPWYDNQPDGLVYAGKVAYQYKGEMPANTSIVLEEGTVSISANAFNDCSGLTSITIPDGVTSIGNSAFAYCNGLNSIIIPSGVTSIGDGAFEGCGSLTSITIPQSVINIGSNAFYDTPWYDNQPDGLVYVGKVAYIFKGQMPSNTSIVLEDGTISISHGAFSSCSGLTSITIPEGVTSIGNGAFSGCSSLTSITIPDGVTSISHEIFYGCSSLTNITIPDGVTSIGCSAFENCNSLMSITIPIGVTSIGEKAFSGCSDLTSVHISSLAPWLNYDWNSLPSTIQVYLNNVKIEEIIRADIPNGISSIRNSAFSGFSNLTTVTIPDGVTSIGSNAFYGCSGLTGITIPDGVTYIGDCAFQECSGLTSIAIPDGVTSIGYRVFYKCSSLQSITIPNGVTSIGSYAFYYCSDMTNITIPDGVTSIDSYTFSGCSGLTSVSIPDRVTSIGHYAFQFCRKLSSVNISNLSAWCNISFADETSNPLYYAHHLYLNGEEIKDLVIPDDISTIGAYTFRNGSGFTSLKLPDDITIIPESVFSGCSGLTSVTLPNQLSIIKANAFNGCSSLKTVNIPASVEYIYQNAFAGCTSLEQINAQPTTPPFLYDNSFPDYSVPVNVPTGTANTYQEAQGWSNFTTINDGNLYYQLTVTVDNHGKATYGENEVKNTTTTFNVKEGNDATITFTPDEGYKIKTVTVDGVDKTAEVNAGTLTFSNMTTNKTVVVSFVVDADMTAVTIGSAGMATFCSSYDLDFSEVEGLSAYIGAGFNTKSGKLSMLQVTDVPAGTGLFLVGKAGSYDVPQLASASIFANLLCGVTTATTLAPTDGGYTNYILSDGPNGVGFYKVSASGDLPAGKAYLRLPTPTAGARMMISIDFNDNTTGISDLTDDDAESAAWYDLQGRRYDSKPTQAGLYIINGRLTIVK